MDSKSFTEQCPNQSKDLYLVDFMNGIDHASDANIGNVEPSSLEPVTPDAYEENVDPKSPITLFREFPKPMPSDSQVAKSNNPQIASIHMSTSPETPKALQFNPFAPGPDVMVLAPYGEKSFDAANRDASINSNTARQIHFTTQFANLSLDDDKTSDEEMFESVYENILEAILPNLTEEALSKISNVESDFEACRTPILAPRLSLVSETCPGAPLRPLSGELRNIGLGLRGKLDF